MTLQNIETNGRLLFKYVRGSTLYGTAIDGVSDIDYGGWYYAPPKDLLGLGLNYQDEIKDERGDVCLYELAKIGRLLCKSNPNILESVFVPDDKIIIKPHKALMPLFENKDKFITKECFNPFVGYAYTQIKKARGMNKKVFQPMVARKDVVDFCYIVFGNGSKNMKEWLSMMGLKQEYIGLANINNMKDIYTCYYDWGAHIADAGWKTAADVYNIYIDDEKKERDFYKFWKETVSELFCIYHWDPNDIQGFIDRHPPIGYRGIMDTHNETSDVRLSSIPKGEEHIGIMSFSKDAFSTHCKQYWEFKDWEAKRNPERFANTLAHGKGFDAKNLTHTVRLMHMAKEIANGEGFNVVRTWDLPLLMQIRRGEKDYDELMEYVEALKAEIDELILKSTLPEKVDAEWLDDLLYNIRMELND